MSTLLICSLPALHAQDVWVGGGADSNWSTPANWQSNSAPVSGSDLQFQGSTRTTNNNDFAPFGISISSLTFDANAAAFTLQGLPISFFGSGAALNTITNNSSNLQTLSFSDSGPFGGITVADNNGGVTINAASGNFNITSNIILYNFSNLGGSLAVDGSHNTTISGNITEGALPASLTKFGTGTLQLNGSNTYSGTTFMEDGTLIVNAFQALGLGDFDLFSGTLRTLEAVPRTYSVGGIYSQLDGTVLFQIGGLTAGTHDLIQVGSEAFLPTFPGGSGSFFVHRVFNFSPVPGDTVQILTAPTGVFGEWSGTPNNTIAPNDFPGLTQPFVIYNASNVTIDFELSNSFLSQALTHNQRAVAENVDDSVGDPRAASLLAFLGNDLPGNLPHDFDLIAPEELASLYEISFSQAVVHNDNLMRRMDDIRAGSNGYSGPIVEVPRNDTRDYTMAIQDKNVVLPDKNVAPAFVPCPENRWGVFALGTGDFVNVGNDDDNAHGYDLETGSVTVGADYRFCNHFAMGIDGSYFSSTADLVDNGRIDADGGKIGGYATFFGKGLFGSRFHVDAAVDGGWNSYDTLRTGLQNLPVRGSTNGSEFNGLIAWGSDWTFGCFNIGTWSTLQYTNVSIDSFTEHGSLAPLEIQDQDQDSFRGTTGVRLSYDIKAGRCAIVRPEVRAAWQHEYGDQAYPIDARFASGAGGIFSVLGPTIGRDAALVGAGLSVQWCSRFSTYVFYDGVLGRDNYDNNAVSGGLRFGF